MGVSEIHRVSLDASIVHAIPLPPCFTSRPLVFPSCTHLWYIVKLHKHALLLWLPSSTDNATFNQSEQLTSHRVWLKLGVCFTQIQYTPAAHFKGGGFWDAVQIAHCDYSSPKGKKKSVTKIKCRMCVYFSWALWKKSQCSHYFVTCGLTVVHHVQNLWLWFNYVNSVCWNLCSLVIPVLKNSFPAQITWEPDNNGC